MIELKKVSKIYQAGKTRVYGAKDISFLVKDGESVAVTGTGAGSAMGAAFSRKELISLLRISSRKTARQLLLSR